MNNTNKKLLKDSLYIHKNIKEIEKNGAEYRWKSKKVFEDYLLYDGTSLNAIEVKDCKSFSIDHSFYMTSDASLKIDLSTNIENVTPRPWPSIKLNLNHQDFSHYNRIKVNIYIKAEGYQNFYFQYGVGNGNIIANHSPSITPNRWEKIIWEIGDVKRNDVTFLSINPWLTGCPPEALPNIAIYIDSLYLEVVEDEYVEGWSLQDRIAYSHVGYLPNMKKIAIISECSDDKFYLLNENNQVVFCNQITKEETKLGHFYLLDFTNFNIIGSYRLKVDERYTPSFVIANDAYEESIIKSLNFLRSLRCGVDVPGVHSACHLNCRTVNSNGDSVPNFGGWHDAGDVSQFEIPTAEITNALFDLADKYDGIDKDFAERIKEEGKIGAEWLLRTRFNDGSRALAVTYSIWRQNILCKDNKTIYSNVAENGPFENFLSAAALASAAMNIKDDDIFASWCKRAAIEDFKFAVDGYKNGLYSKRWGPSIDSQVAGHACIAACYLFELTSDSYYEKMGEYFSDIVLQCQQQEYLDCEKPLRGFFYEDIGHKWLLTYEHRGHEQSPIQGLCMLCETFPDNNNFIKWYHGIELYRDYIVDSLKYTSPYGVLPGHIYILDKINKERFTIPRSYGTIEEGLAILKEQARHGIRLGNDIYLRIFPIAVQRRGFHATLLSKAKAVSMAAKILHDNNLKQVAINQLEWVMGKNPFATSSMFGCGYNYHPLYVAFSKQIVGALPVGFMTNGDNDQPYWPTRDHAVYKEIWGHTTGKYLWVLADFI